MKKKRAPKGDGSVYKVAGRYCAAGSLGKDPATGKRRRVYRYAETPTKAKRALRQALAEAATDKPVTAADLTLRQWVPAWLDEAEARGDIKASTRKHYEFNLAKHILNPLGNRYLAAITSENIDDWLKTLKVNGMKPRTMRINFGIVRGALLAAVDAKKLQKSPHHDCRMVPKADTPKMGVWSQDQANQFLAWAKGSSPNYYAFYVLALTTGMRLGELLGLQWPKLDFGTNTIRINAQTNEHNGRILDPPLVPPKTVKSVRTIAVHPRVMAMLRTRQAGTSSLYVFPNAKGVGPLLKSNVGRKFRADACCSRVPRIRFHDMRHCHATFVLAQGGHGAARAVQERLGHSNINITLGTYTHVLREQQEQVASIGAAAVGIR